MKHPLEVTTSASSAKQLQDRFHIPREQRGFPRLEHRFTLRALRVHARDGCDARQQHQ
jgi:hypothetical protein